MSLSEGIKKARKKAGITQVQLAEMIGVNRATVSKYESGAISPPLSQVIEIADALNSTISELVGLNPIFDTPENRVAVDAAAEMMVRAGIRAEAHTPMTRINAALEKLNEEGQNVAADRVEELTEIPRYIGNSDPSTET